MTRFPSSRYPDEPGSPSKWLSRRRTSAAPLEGELWRLERAWREAEEIAGISDNLLLPKGVADSRGWSQGSQSDSMGDDSGD